MKKNLKPLNTKELELKEKQLKQIQKMTDATLSNILSDRERAEDLYAFMQELIEMEKDGSDATRNSMVKALELKLKANEQLIRIMEIQAKLVNNKANSNININIGTYDKKGGDTNNLIDLAETIDIDEIDNEKDNLLSEVNKITKEE